MADNIGDQSEFLAAHEDVVKRVLEQQPDDEYLYDLAELFKVFGDSTRIRILYERYRAAFESWTVGGQSPAKDSQGCEAGQIPQGG